MFGYIKPDIPELKVREHELYKATYCGLCKTMGKCTGCFSRMTLSYDFAFFALLRMVVDKTKANVRMGHCIIHPIRKRPIMDMNDTLKFSAKASVILTRMKLKDNINDSNGLRKLKAKIAGIVSVFLKKTDKELKPLEELVRKSIEDLSLLEKEGCDSIDQTANTFGELLGNVASFGYDERTAKLMYSIGFHLGKWIYVVDAVDDMADDVKKKSFNALVNSFGSELSSDNKEMLYSAMMLELSAMSKGIELLDFSEYRDIEGLIKNIIYSGMVKESNRVLGLATKDSN